MKKSIGLLIILFSVLMLAGCELPTLPSFTQNPTKEPTPTVKLETYDIIYVYNNDEKTVNKFSFEEGTEITTPDISSITKVGFEPESWYKESDFITKVTFPFKLNGNTKLYLKWVPVKEETPTPSPTPTPEPINYTVTLMDGEKILSQDTITENQLYSKPTNPTKDGFEFICWSTNPDFKQEYNFNTPVTTDLTLYAIWEEIVVNSSINITNFGGYNEGAYLEFEGNIVDSFEITYNKNGSSTIYKLDKELIRKYNNIIRCDILGLTNGTYNFTITNTSTNSTISKTITVSSHDRSGYAHFDNNGGVGAYNDDGSLKSNAIVIYVNDFNKNTVTAKIGDKTYTGLGAILSAASKSSYPICVRILDTIKTAQWNSMSHGAGKTSQRQNNLNKVFNNAKDFTNGKLYYDKIVSLGINSMSNDLNNGITILNGLTTSVSYSGGEYDSYYNMLDISNGSNITIEGVGTNAGIYQWGINFKKCNNIEVRNLTFDRYTEDALGFEGDKNNISTFGNYWIHNCTFNIGVNNWDVCYEADKGDGDGSTDFKYCRGVTISYCQYNKTHKTILIGGSDSAKQYNFTLHHNYFNNCSSRLPLTRQTNIHLYNNYFYKTTGTCSSIRANCSMFAENNYYESAKNPFNLIKTSTYTGTSLKALGNYFTNCSTSKNSSDGLTTYLKANNVSSRTEQIKGSCNPTGSKELINFDTNSSLFYYDSINKISDVSNMLEASTVKEHCIKYAGVLK